MTTEQAPGIPWHDHEWVEATSLGDAERYFVCAYGGLNIGCPAQKFEPIPLPPKPCPTCGQLVYE